MRVFSFLRFCRLILCCPHLTTLQLLKNSTANREIQKRTRLYLSIPMVSATAAYHCGRMNSHGHSDGSAGKRFVFLSKKKKQKTKKRQVEPSVTCFTNAAATRTQRRVYINKSKKPILFDARAAKPGEMDDGNSCFLLLFFLSKKTFQ